MPESVRKAESEIQLLRAKKTAITREVEAIKDKINEVNIQDVQLTGKGTARLSSQLDPASKVAIEEQDIARYAEILEKIRVRLDETFKTIPPEHIPERSPEMIEQILSPAGKTPAGTTPATPFTPLPISPSPAKSNTSGISAGFDL